MTISQQINQIANKFTKAYESGQSPSIADFVNRIDAKHRQQLLQALIPLDIKFHQQQNQPVSSNAYAEFGVEAVEIARHEISSSTIGPESDADGTLMFEAQQSQKDDEFIVNQSVLTNLGQTIDIAPNVVLRDPR